MILLSVLARRRGFVASSPAIAAMAYICSCCRSGSSCGVRRRSLPDRCERKFAFSWQPWAVVQQSSPLRVQHLFVPIFAKKWGCVRVPTGTRPPHGVTYVHGRLEPAGGCRGVCRNKNAAAEYRVHEKEDRSTERPSSRLSRNTSESNMAGQCDCLDLASFELGHVPEPGLGSKHVVPNSRQAAMTIHRYRGAMPSRQKPAR